MHPSRLPIRRFLAAALLGLTALAHAGDTPAAAGTTRVARWKDDRTAAFLLMFDDSWPSHWQVAAPELAKRGMTATFYICPGKGEHQKFAKEWEETLPKLGMAYGDHTMTHAGVKDLENAEHEIGDCARWIRQTLPGKQDRLVSYGQPGVAADAWKISEPQLDELLKKHHLISRPTFVDHGAVYHLKTAPEMLALADRAIADRGMEYVVIHGVERITPDWGYQDMWPLKQEIFFALLDGLKDRRDKGELWITDHISMHQYATERDQAEVQVVAATASTIRLNLKCKADPALYDLPLTLVTRVPADWEQATIIQCDRKTSAKADQGAVRFEASPGFIVLEKAAAP